MAIYDTMQYIKNDVVTIAMGLAASMGQFLLSAGTPGKRFALPNAEILIHQPSAGLAGSASDIKIHAERLLHTKRRMAELTSQHTGQTIEQITRDSDRDRWFDAFEAKEYGLIDDVIATAAGDAGRRRHGRLSHPPPRADRLSPFTGDTVNDFPGSGLYDRVNAAQDMRAASQGRYTGPQAESRYVIPRFVERTSQGVREYDPYAKLFEERVIFLGVQIDDASANDVMAQLLCLESMDPDRDISVYINSPGGSFTALTAIYDTMQYVKPDVQTVCMGQAASAAAVLLAAGTPGKRMALPNARVLIHQPYSETGRGQVSDLEIAANEILRMRSQLEEMLAKHSTTPVEKIREDIERDKILTAEDALSYGLIDQIITTRKMDNSSLR